MNLLTEEVYNQIALNYLENNTTVKGSSNLNGFNIKNSNFYIPESMDQFNKLIEVSKLQLENHKGKRNGDVKSQLYFKQIYMNRYIREPMPNFLTPNLPINNETDAENNRLIHKLNIKKIINHIKDTNSTFFNSFYEKLDEMNYKYKSITVDGTCCVGKSTLLSLLSQHGINHAKSNNMMYTSNINTHISYSMGYSYKSLELMEEYENMVWDRSPYNNIFWFKLWCIISKTFNVDVLDELHFSMFRTILESDSSNVLEQIFLTCVPNILIVNSDEDFCKQKLKCRKTGSDVERSNWNHYITIQNFAYSWLASKYPNKIILIDAAQYINNHVNGHSLLQESIVEIIKDLMPRLKHNTTFINQKLNDHKISYFNDTFNVENKILPLLMSFKMDMQKDIVEAIKQQCMIHGVDECSNEFITDYMNKCIHDNKGIVDDAVNLYNNNDSHTNGDVIKNVNDGELDIEDINF